MAPLYVQGDPERGERMARWESRGQHPHIKEELYQAHQEGFRSQMLFAGGTYLLALPGALFGEVLAPAMGLGLLGSALALGP